MWKRQPVRGNGQLVRRQWQWQDKHVQVEVLPDAGFIELNGTPPLFCVAASVDKDSVGLPMPPGCSPLLAHRSTVSSRFPPLDTQPQTQRPTPQVPPTPSRTPGLPLQSASTLTSSCNRTNTGV